MSIRSLSLFLYSGLAFAAAVSTSPVLTYSTYLRDSFTPTAIATDSAGNIYLAGNAIVDPVTGQNTVLVVKLNPQASQYIYVRYLGGSVVDFANAIAVDVVGNAYVAGWTQSPDFPVTGGGNLGTPPPANVLNQQRSFVAKFDPSGELLFSDLLGGSSSNAAKAVAVNAAGQILVSGTCGDPGDCSSGFPSTPGAYSIPNSNGHPYLLELDPTGKNIIFSATGIGGTAIAVDSSGNIYVAGTTSLLDYPTTPGTYQPAFPVFNYCPGGVCMMEFQGSNQYVTKVDPTGSKLLYSTSVSGKDNTTNTGLAVDATGNVYVTGYAGSSYPYTVPPPAVTPAAQEGPFFPGLPFLSKLDPVGHTLLFSVPIGGAGVQVDSNGAVYAGGGVGSSLNVGFVYTAGTPNNPTPGITGFGYAVTASIPALASIPTQCLPNNLTIMNSAYVSQLDAGSGRLLGTQFIGGSNLTISGVALSGSSLWFAGATSLPDFPFTPDVLTLPNIGPSPLEGTYLGAVDFSQAAPPAGTPQVACMLDGADLAPAGPATPSQILAVFGSGLGPAKGVNATNYTTTSLAGVDIRIGDVPAPLLYVSSNQINLAVPSAPNSQFARMTLAVNGASAPSRRIPLTLANPSLFINAAQSYPSGAFPLFVAWALNADGSVNTADNPAQSGSVISVFVNGLSGFTSLATDFEPVELSTTGGWSVKNIVQVSPFVMRVDAQLPGAAPPPGSTGSVGVMPLTLYMLNPAFNAHASSPFELAFGGIVYVQ